MHRNLSCRPAPPLAAAGYILIEGLVSLMVVAAGILGVAKLQSAVVTASADAKATSTAYSLARAKIEELRVTTQRSQHSGTNCTAGTDVKNGSDTVATVGAETTYSRTWTVTPLKNKDGSCDALRHRVTVQVSWSTREGSKNVSLTSIVAWNDPLLASPTVGTGGAGSGGGVGAPPSAARFVPDNYAYTIKTSFPSSYNDGASVVLSDAGEYILRIDEKAKIASNVPFVRLSGLVALDQASGTKATMKIQDIVVYRTDITYCIFPLPFTNPDDPNTYGLRPPGTPGVTLSTDTAAAYVCYVPEGWRGNIGLLEKAPCGNKGNDKLCLISDDHLACPDDLSPGTRNIKTLVRDSNGAVIGASGVLPSHEVLPMPGYSNIMQTWRLDFAIFLNPKGSKKTCKQRFDTVGSGVSGILPAPHDVILRVNHYHRNGSVQNGLEGVPSLIDSLHALANEASLLRTVTGTATNCTAVAAQGDYPYGNVTCPVSDGNYTCHLPYGWKGSLQATPNGVPPAINVASLTLSLTNQNFVCAASP